MRLFNTVQLDSEPPMVYSQMPKTSTRKIEWEKIAEGENGVDKFLASVNIHKKNYFGLTLGTVHK